MCIIFRSNVWAILLTGTILFFTPLKGHRNGRFETIWVKIAMSDFYIIILTGFLLKKTRNKVQKN